jgi:hypothetical protein
LLSLVTTSQPSRSGSKVRSSSSFGFASLRTLSNGGGDFFALIHLSAWKVKSENGRDTPSGGVCFMLTAVGTHFGRCW